MNGIDLDAVREDAQWLQRYENGEVDIDEVDPIIAGLSCADAVLALTDPAPLTVERLVETAFCIAELFGHRTAFYRGFHVVGVDLPEDDRMWKLSDLRDLTVPPRTVGELRQLILRTEERR